MLKRKTFTVLLGVAFGLSCLLVRPNTARTETMSDYSLIPPFVTAGAAPLVMLVLGRDHKLYFPAYNDATDLDGDGTAEIHYKPSIDYYGYFDSHKCYSYSSTNGRFEPTGTTTNKQCSGTWSGDYLNYLSMSRMDALRKVFYGGYRSTDTATDTTLQRAFIPQDSHSWGKEYRGVSRDGYDISNYTPLSLPETNNYHLFANTTLTENGTPLLRVCTNTPRRIWEWTSKESPEATTGFQTGSATMTAPTNHADFVTLLGQYQTTGHQECSATISSSQINGSGNPCSGGATSYFVSVITATLTVKTAGTYQFAADGGSAVEAQITDSTGSIVKVAYFGYYNSHNACACRTHTSTSVTLASGTYKVTFNQMVLDDSPSWYLYWKGPDSSNSWAIIPKLSSSSGLSSVTQTVYNMLSTITDYAVRVQVALTSMPESNCQQYPNGVYKPVGILQKYGASDRMLFGLMTGSYAKNMGGGVLRKKVSSISDEIDADTGQFTHIKNNTTDGIIGTIDTLRTVGYSYSAYSYNTNCGLITKTPLDENPEGTCSMWGNPIAEMMYETLRYFAGKAAPTPAFTYSGTTQDSTLGLPLASTSDWADPYATVPSCAKPFMVVISDIYPSYDSDQLPGSAFATFAGDSLAATGKRTAMNVTDLGNTISSNESISGSYFIGQSGSTYDGSCSPKTVSGLGSIRGLCPEEPTKNGSYYSAAVAFYGRTNSITSPSSSQSVTTYTIGLASPNPDFTITVGSKTIRLVPFAKSATYGSSINSSKGAFQPTDQNVGIWIDYLSSTSGSFRWNWEDAEQGNDFDMDVIVQYQYQVVDGAGNAVSDPANGVAVKISATALYDSQGINTHSGYIVSGSTADGTYIVIRDKNNAYTPYWMDCCTTDNTCVTDSGYTGTSCTSSNFTNTSTRTFYPGSSPAATTIKNPLWYAAKWGGFEDTNNNNLPDIEEEWNKTGTGTPDNYSFVQSPLQIENALNSSFSDILRRSASGTAASVISNSRSGEGAIYQALFYPEYKDDLGNTVHWAGDIHALLVDAYGNMREDTLGSRQLDVANDYILVFSSTLTSTLYKYTDTNANGELDTSETTSPIVVGTMRPCRDDEMLKPAAQRSCIAYLWSTAFVLNQLSDTDIVAQRTPYSDTSSKRYIFTFIDGKSSGSTPDMIPQSGEIVDFVDTNSDAIGPYVHLYPPFTGSAPSWAPSQSNTAAYSDFVSRQAKRIINFIRGQDQAVFTSSTSPSYTLPASRSRKSDYDESGTAKTWRLGDIVYSTPTIVAAPSEDFDLLYADESYIDFYRLYVNRRTVVYAGANDGMLHAINGGFYDSTNTKFWKGYSSSTGVYSDTGKVLGSELWAYIPYNLLPHLYWLTDSAYDSEYHINYVDLKPRIFDAKIFTADSVHPNGWGTVLVCGMRFGGGKIRADIDHNNAYSTSTTPPDRIMRSAYIVMDITDPESAPTLLAEISDDSLGYTTCYPTVIAMKSKNSSSTQNDWYLVLGSGPHGSSGPDGTAGADNTALVNATSDQPAKIVLVSLNELAAGNGVKTVDGSTDALSTAGQVKVFASLDTNSFVSDPVTVDFDLDYKADAVYFGTVSGNYTTNWGGKLRRIVQADNPSISAWTKDSTLIDLSSVKGYDDAGTTVTTDYGYGQPVVAAPTVGLDSNNQPWVFFGTGRFFNRQDATHSTSSNQQSYYGIKEPLTSGAPSWTTVTRNLLMDVTNVKIFEDEEVTGATGVTDFSSLQSKIASKSGWFLNLSTTGERNLGQATLLGDVLTFTSYVPSTDVCQFEGVSNLYACYYTTGTAYPTAVIGLGTNSITGTDGTAKYEVLRSTSLGKGLTMTPNIHTGKESGSNVYIQTSTGTILQIKEQNPGVVKSGVVSWEELN